MKKNTLYYGDNLHVLREQVADESVDLIYLDPPFNSKRDYNLLFKTPKGMESDAQITAFEDSWHWAQQAEDEFKEIVNPSAELRRLRGSNTDVADLMNALRAFLKENDMLAYLTMMCNRLLELHRVLKPTGSLYLHCDPTASHYLKLVLDGVFGKECFRNEIIWQRTIAKSHAFTRLPSNHDVILFFQKSEVATWNSSATTLGYDANDLDEKTSSKYKHKDDNGRIYRLDSLINPNANRPNLTYEFLGVTRVWRWTRERMQKAFDDGIVVQTKPGTVPQMKRFLDEQEGRALGDMWSDINPINSQAQERLGYPTQKPLALLERIISASSNEGDVVLDPFCGCGTAVHAAEKLGRRWIGIDITHLSVSLIEKRMKKAFPALEQKGAFEIVGVPQDFDAAKDLAERDKYQFQFWACTLVNAQPYKGGKKGADGGVDGIIYAEVGKNKTEKIVVSVKGGANISNGMIRDLKGAMEREKAIMGLFITLAPPTKPMVTEAASAGHYESEHFPRPFAKIQILTIQGLLDGTERADFPDLSMGGQTFKAAKTDSTKKKSDQKALFD